MDPVSKAKVMEETIRREERSIRLTTQFNLSDPRKMSLLPAKPNQTTPAAQPTEQQLQEAAAKLGQLANVKHAAQSPSQVYPLPLTSSMEIGWVSRPLVAADPLYCHFKGHCDVTRFAADFCALKGGEHLFSAKNAAGQPAKKQQAAGGK